VNDNDAALPTPPEGLPGVDLDSASSAEPDPIPRIVLSPNTKQTSGELKTAAISGARSYALSRIAIEAANFGSIIVLARIIGPAATGRAAVALVFPMLAVILTFEGFGGVLVQRVETSSKHLRTAMSLSLLSGLLLSALLALFAMTIAPPLFGRLTARLILLASPVFIIASTGCVSRALLMRDLRFKLMSRRDSATIVLTSALTVVLAVLGFQASSYIWAALIGTALDALIMMFSARPSGIGWDRDAAREIFAYGLPAAASGLVITLRGNIDYIILGAVVPGRITGIYYRAFQFGGVYQSKVSAVFVTMLFPLLSRARSDEDLRQMRQQTAAINAIVSLPLLGILVALAPQVVPLLYGPKWAAAVLPTQILSGVGMVTALNIGSQSVAQALGRSSLLFKVQFAFLITYAAAIFVAAHIGLTTVCFTAFGVYSVMLLVDQRVLIDNLLGLPITQLAKDIGPAVAGSAISIGVASGVAAALSMLPAIVIVSLASAAALTAYVATLRLGFPGTWRGLTGLTRSFVGRP
jgi:O-antigen/teichoic acid export membrane protein